VAESFFFLPILRLSIMIRAGVVLDTGTAFSDLSIWRQDTIWLLR